VKCIEVVMLMERKSAVSCTPHSGACMGVGMHGTDPVRVVARVQSYA
jgi:hypothetical protein